MNMNMDDVMRELWSLGTERTKKSTIGRGAREPLFGVATGAMTPLAKKIGKDQALAEELYATGNYDAMYFAGMIAEPNAMTRFDYERWMEGAYFPMIADYIVAVTLSEADIAQEVADAWIAGGHDLRASAGWSCYCWLLGSKPDETFDEHKIAHLLDYARAELHSQPECVKFAMNNFILSVGVSYKPLHQRALDAARAVGSVTAGVKCGVPVAAEEIEKAAAKGRIGFKRRAVRC